jgi:hypothetical protein
MGTLRLVRRITSDGELSLEEIWDLAHYLNGNESAQHKWPGQRLWRQIERAMEDGEISDQEHQHLGDIIVEIEEACAGISTGITNIHNRINLDGITVSDLKLPIINQTVFVEPRADDDQKYTLDLRSHTCTCPDWFARHKDIPQGSFGRACKHIAAALAEARENGEPITKQWDKRAAQLIEQLGRLELGADPFTNWQHIAWEDGDAFVGWDKSDWASIFANIGIGEYERYGFNLEDERWAYSEQPPHADLIAGYLKYKA